jgi:plastocyanin
MQFTLSVLASLLPLTLAQYGGAPAPVVVNDPSTTSTPAAPAATKSATGPAVAIQTVSVGADGNIAYSPNTLTAAVGSQVEFVFFPPTHSVTQGTFANPCVPAELNGTGFWSGGMTTASGMNANSFTITINDTNPIWFFCSFPTHCENFGMAGVINPP